MNAHVRAVRVRTLWRTRAAARAQGPMHDIWPSLLSSPFIPCHPHCLFTPLSSGLWDSLDDVLSIAAHVTGEVGYKTRVSARLHPASLFYPIVRAPDYDVSLRHCTATHQHECFCVRRTPSHTASPDSVMTFFVHGLPKNVGAISPRGSAWFSARPSIHYWYYPGLGMKVLSREPFASHPPQMERTFCHPPFGI